jgi:hypothetical protein
MKKAPFKKPEAYKKEMSKVVVSSRVSQKCKETLDWAATNQGMRVSELVAGILEDYSDWFLKEVMSASHKAQGRFK